MSRLDRYLLKNVFVSFALGIFLSTAAAQSTSKAIAVTEVAKGSVVRKVACTGEPEQTYAAYVPSYYKPDRKWPIVYAFDPGARGWVPVELMKDAAEKYGYIVVGSNNSKNGPTGPQLQAAKAVWNDTHQRFAIDEQRTYTSGFSGGARVATMIALQCGCVAGVFANGAGFPEAKAPTAPVPFVVFVAIGDIDFNHAEIVQLGHALDKAGVINRVREFSGPHQWAPAEVFAEAFQWFNLRAMRKGLMPTDAAFIADRFNAAVQSAKAVEASGDAYAADQQYEKILQDFNDLQDVSVIAIAKTAEDLKKTKSWKARQKQEGDEADEQVGITLQILPALNSLQNSPAERETFLATLRGKLNDLKRAAEKPRNDSQRRVSKRALSQITAQLYETGEAQIRKGQYAQAVVNFELVSELIPQSPGPYYGQATAYALAGDKKKAIRALKEAVNRGFKEAAVLREDSDFAKIREDEEFKKLLASIGEATPAQK